MGFREKNKDALHPDMVAIVRSSANPFMQGLFPEEKTSKTSKGRMPTLAAQVGWPSQLSALLWYWE